MNTTDTNFLTIGLSKEYHEIAREFSLQQDTVEKGKQVYLNTLAILGVRSLLDWLGIETELSQEGSWHPVVRCFRDVADLVIPNLGKLECRPVLPGETVISLPSEVTEDRIAYIAVQFQEQLNEVELLGFYPAIDPQAPPEEIEIANLKPIESLIDYLDRLESAQDFLQSDDAVAVRIRERLTDQPISEIVTQIERIYRTCSPNERRYAGGEFLASYIPTQKGFSFRGGTPIVDREDFDQSQQTELQDLAEELLEKLDEIWGTDDLDESLIPKPLTNTPTSARLQDNQPVIISQAVVSTSGLINLSEWLQYPDNSFQDNWQTLESFLSNKEGNLIFRFASAPRSRSTDPETSTKSRTKVREIQLKQYPLALILNLELESDGKRDILLRLYPTDQSQTYLPAGVQLIVLDESEDIFLEAQARSADNWIQLEFRGETGERFAVKVALSDASITEEFVI